MLIGFPDPVARAVDESRGLDSVLLDHVVARQMGREGGPAAVLAVAQLV